MVLGLVGLFKTIFFIIAFFLVLRLLIRFVLPILAKFFIGRTIRNMQKNQGGAYGSTVNKNPDEVEKKVGDVTVKFKPKKDKPKDDDKGEYTDFEEVK
ncbi:MAG: DUF4834 family protein [Luteibaculaceae bacterium]